MGELCSGGGGDYGCCRCKWGGWGGLSQLSVLENWLAEHTHNRVSDQVGNEGDYGVVGYMYLLTTAVIVMRGRKGQARSGGCEREAAVAANSTGGNEEEQK